jgi:hypothetical protein
MFFCHGAFFYVTNKTWGSNESGKTTQADFKIRSSFQPTTGRNGEKPMN